MKACADVWMHLRGYNGNGDFTLRVQEFCCWKNPDATPAGIPFRFPRADERACRSFCGEGVRDILN
jgi:hypothetical protein